MNFLYPAEMLLFLLYFFTWDTLEAVFENGATNEHRRLEQEAISSIGDWLSSAFAETHFWASLDVMFSAFRVYPWTSSISWPSGIDMNLLLSDPRTLPHHPATENLWVQADAWLLQLWADLPSLANIWLWTTTARHGDILIDLTIWKRFEMEAGIFGIDSAVDNLCSGPFWKLSMNGKSGQYSLTWFPPRPQTSRGYT